MKPAWDKLGYQYRNDEKVQIIDVDCTAEPGGQELCGEFGVQGFPTIKYFDGSDDQGAAYEGGRDFEQLDSFVKENLMTKCDPISKEGCSEAVTEVLKTYENLSADELNQKAEDFKKDLEAAKEKFETILKGLQETYEKEQAAMEETQKDIKPKLGAVKLLAKVKSAGKTEL